MDFSSCWTHLFCLSLYNPSTAEPQKKFLPHGLCQKLKSTICHGILRQKLEQSYKMPTLEIFFEKLLCNAS